MVRILLADDHNVVRKGLRLLLESHPGFRVIGDVADGRAAVEFAEKERPDVLIIDIAMPFLNGIEAARQIGLKDPTIAIVFLSMHSDEAYLMKALKVGARAYLLKDSAEHDLLHAVEAVSEGKAFFSPAIAKILAQDYLRQIGHQEVEDPFDRLTTREREILQLLGEGRSNKDVANCLQLSLHTVETHRSNIMEKLDLHTAADIVLYAIRKGVVV